MKPVTLGGITVDCIDPHSLSDFYVKLLGWKKTYEDEGFVSISSSECNVRIGFQRNLDYLPPVWPEIPERQQQMLHLDFKVRNKEEMAFMVQHAENCGAKQADMQYSDLWTVMIDPAGHPFCFDTL